jgi:hypothetical protein
MRDMRDIDLQNIGTHSQIKVKPAGLLFCHHCFAKSNPASIYRLSKVNVSHVSHVSHPQIAQKCKILKIPPCLSPILKCLSLVSRMSLTRETQKIGFQVSPPVDIRKACSPCPELVDNPDVLASPGRFLRPMAEIVPVHSRI